VKNMIAIIPARGGSKGLPGKNLRSLEGLPLIAWTIKSAQECQLVDSIVVTSDDSEILSIASEFGVSQLIRRPDELATDDSTTGDAVRHVLSVIERPENFVLLQPTSPLRNSAILTESIRLFQNSKSKSLVSVTRSTESPYWTFKLTNGLLQRVIEDSLFLDQRQKLPKTYVLNGAIYIWNTSHFLSHGDLISNSTLGFEMSSEVSIDIDSLEDFEEATRIFRRVNNIKTEKEFR